MEAWEILVTCLGSSCYDSGVNALSVTLDSDSRPRSMPLAGGWFMGLAAVEKFRLDARKNLLVIKWWNVWIKLQMAFTYYFDYDYRGLPERFPWEIVCTTVPTLVPVQFHNYNNYWSSSVCLVAQSCPTLGDPTDCNPQSSSVHGILQARILEWVAISSSRGSSQHRSPAL